MTLLPIGQHEIPLDALREADDNPRTITDERFERLKYTLTRMPGLLEDRPLIATPDGTVIAGNMRLRAARALGWDRVPVSVRDPTPDERREIITLDNQPFGEWVPEELAALVRAHEEEGGDLALLGFADAEIEALRLLAADAPEPGGLPGADPDACPEPPAEPTTQPGDVWTLGAHRLVCADAVHDASYATLLGDEDVDAIWTDPPYGVNYDPENRVLTDFGIERTERPLGAIIGDDRDGVGYAEWLACVLAAATAPLRAGGPVYLCHADRMAEWAHRAWRLADLHFASALLWVKSRIVFDRGDYHSRHEPLIYGWKKGAAHAWFSDAKQETVFEVASDHYGDNRQAYVAPTQKPYDLIRPMLENSTQPDDVVLDPFGGSGSTLIVCEQIGRRARLLELDPYYCDVIVARWEAFTGRSAER